VNGLSPEAAVAALASLRFGDVFNPYSDTCPEHDLDGAPAIRRCNLLATFRAAVSLGVDELWIALEPGHRGARRTGLAMTDEAHLEAHARRWELDGIGRATRDGPETEQTAGIVWGALADIKERVLLWNLFPLHCHVAGSPLSNRRHTSGERAASWDLTRAILGMVRPGRIVAIGQEAHEAIGAFDPSCSKVRHPAYGGKADFLSGVSR
jgi:hypothetical protein